jgi:hypothetical protein
VAVPVMVVMGMVMIVVTPLVVVVGMIVVAHRR